MRKSVFSGLLGFCLLTAVIAATAFAQGVPSPDVRATIPFDFSVRGKTFPAGDYEIKRVRDDLPNLLMISNLESAGRAMFETENVEARAITDKGKLVFHRYGDSYFLSEVFEGGEQTGRELLPSRQERSLRLEMASNKTESATVELATY